MPKADWYYGRRPVAEILKSPMKVRQLLLVVGMDEAIASELTSLAQAKGAHVKRVQGEVLDRVTDGTHQGAAVEVERLEPLDFKFFLQTLTIEPGTFVCLLDEIQDPQNLGVIMRSAVCFGCSGIIIPTRRSATFSAGVMKASSGAAAHIPLVEIPNLGVAIERLKEKGFFVYGADAAPGAVPLETADFAFPLALVLGNEHEGIRPVLKKSCDALVHIPQAEKVASLNVAQAATIFFYEIRKKTNLI